MADERPTAGAQAGQLHQAKVHAFAERAFADLSATYVAAMCLIGDRLGLFKDLAAHGQATSAELAARTGIQERYAREWLSALACAGYLTYDPTSRSFALPPEHAPALAEEGGPLFLGAEYHQLQGLFSVFDPLLAAFRQGGGVPQFAYHPSFWDGLDRSSALYASTLLVQQWLAAVPEVEAALTRGVAVADIGCGRGRALLTLAQAFPASRYVGYDVFAPTIAAAEASAVAAGVADRVRFAGLDVARGLPEQYDVVLTVNVVHDAADPLGLLRAIRAGLRPGGTYLCAEPSAAETMEGNAGPRGAYMYGTSVLYCLTTALVEGDAGLGTAGLTEAKMRALCTEAGFGAVRRLALDDPIRGVYTVQL